MTETNDPALARMSAEKESSLEPATPPAVQEEAPMDQPEATAEPNRNATLEAAALTDAPRDAAEAESDEGPAGELPAETEAQPAADAECAPEPEQLAQAEPDRPPAETEAQPAVEAEPAPESEPEPAALVAEASPETAAEAAPEVELAAAAIPFAAALEAKNSVQGKVIGWNKGGFHVVSEGVTTFCPRSLMELGNRPRPPAQYVNNTYAFHVLEIREAGRRIVLTRRPAIRHERKRALDRIRTRLGSREPISGKVTSVTDFGAFIDLGGGFGGLVHRTQISRSRLAEPRDLLQVGQNVTAVVTKIEKRNGKRKARISLSMKALEADPWQEAARNLTAGAKFKGKVVRHSEFGLFVEVAPGLDGLVHTSQLPIGKQMSAPEFAVGEQIEGWVVEVTPRRRRLALSLREVPTADPWKKLGKQYVEGAEAEGRVEQVSRSGIFVELEPGLTGLLPMSAVTLPEGNQAQRAYPPGRRLKVVIESIDRRRRRLGLAPAGSQLVGTKADYRNFRKRQKKPAGLNAMAAAFAKLEQTK